jgi:DNA repair exonuclease SbcCD ATPase subunit
MNPEKEIARWRNTINDLQKQLETDNARVAELGKAKKPLTLDAATGDRKAKAKLAEINAEIFAVQQDAADLKQAVEQAQIKLADAEAAKTRQDEAERLKKVREIAEERIELSAAIEASAEELANLCERFRRMGFEMGRAGAWPVGDNRWKQADGRGRLLLTLQKHIGANFDQPANPVDPRLNKALPEMERESLSPFLLSDRGIKELANDAA